MRGIPYLTALIACLFLTACGPKDPTKMKTGKELYDYYCRSCHEEKQLGGYLEKLPAAHKTLKPYELVLMMRHNYENPSKHPSIRLPQLTPEQADVLAQYAYGISNQGN